MANYNTAAGRGEYSSTGSKDFTFVFKIFLKSDIKVYSTPLGEDVDDVVNLKVLDIDYTVTINGDDGGTVSFITAPANDSTIVLVRDLPITRDVDYTQGGDLSAETLDADQNYQTYIISDGVFDIKGENGRALILPDSAVGVNNQLPAFKKGQFLKVNEAATGFEYSDLQVDATNVTKIIDTLIELRDITDTGNNPLVWVSGSSNKNDGAFGSSVFRWNSTSTQVDNNSTVIKLVNIEIGRYELQYNGALSVNLFGANGDNISDNKLSFQTSASSLGYIYLTDGSYLLSDITIDVPIYFGINANIIANVGTTINITNDIHALNTYIFKGEGSYSLGHDSDSGENSREIHVAWFGAKTYPGTNPIDQSGFINKAYQAVGNGRESIVNYDIGNYTLQDTVFSTRASGTIGKGTRRTVFRTTTDGFPLFETSEQGCSFEGIQFELDLGVITTRASEFINIKHGECEVNDVNVGNSKKGIIISGNNCRVDRVRAVYGTSQGANSSTIEVIAGSGTSIDNINVGTSSGFGVDSIVTIGGENQLGSISGVDIGTIYNISASKTLNINSKNGYNISRVNADSLKFNGYSALKPECIVKIANSSNAISDINLGSVIGTSVVDKGILIQTSGTGVIYRIGIDTINYSGGVGIEVNETGGQIDTVSVGASSILYNCTTPFEKIGSPQNITIPPSVRFKNTNPSYSCDASVDNDSVYSVDLGVDIFTGTIIVTAGSYLYGMFLVRIAQSPSNVKMLGSTNVNPRVGLVSGTTGTDGDLSLSVDDNGLVYVENRTGSNHRVCITLNCAISI